MKIMIAGSRPTKEASSDWFTGTVWQDPIVEAPDPASVRALNVAFEPGARTAWHTHPLGQTLHVVSGVGLVGLRKTQVKLGYRWIPPEEHWHGQVHWHGPHRYPRSVGWTNNRVAREGI